MTENPINSFPLRMHRHELRVRYRETDAQGRVHHANYINYFEVGRVEMLRAGGHSYRELEANGLLLVVVELGCQFFDGAVYDDLLTIETTLDWAKGVRIRHSYRILRDTQVLAAGHTIVAAVSPMGKILRLPAWLRAGEQG